MTNSGLVKFSTIAKALLIAAVLLFALGIGMRQFRDVFEPILTVIVPLVGRRGHHMQYLPAYYPGYALAPFVMSGVALVLAGFAKLFSAASPPGSKGSESP